MTNEEQLKEDKKLAASIFAMMIGYPLGIGLGGWLGYTYLGGMFGFMIGVFGFCVLVWGLLSIW